MCLERRTGPVAAAVGVVAVVLCWSSAAWAGAISENTTLDPNTLSIPGESSVTAIPAPEVGGDQLEPFQPFSIAVRGAGPSSDLMVQLPIPATVQPSALSDDGHLAFPADEPNSFDDRSTRFDFSRYPDAISSIHDGRHVSIVDGAPVPEPAVVGGLLALALLVFITWRKRYG